MANVCLLKVIYHIERNGVVTSEHRQINVACAPTQAAVLACMASNGVGAASGSTVKIDSMQNIGCGVS